MEELESGDMKAICTSEGKEYIYRVSSGLYRRIEAATSEAARLLCAKHTFCYEYLIDILYKSALGTTDVEGV